MNLRDPFNPETGEFRKNIRATDAGDLTELRQSMQQFGWLKEFPAYADEHDVVLVGHRRIAVAHELGITPVIEKLTLGDGDKADAERLKIAIASNVGFKPMEKADRQRIAKYLYGERDWTMEQIAKALDVSIQTVSTDLKEFSSDLKTQPRTSKRGRKNEGRPKGSGKLQSKNPEVAKVHARIVDLSDQGLSTKQVAAEVGVGERQVSMILQRERVRKGQEAANNAALSMTAQQRLDAAIRAATRKLEAEYEMRVLTECQRRLNEISLPQYWKEIKELEQSISNRKGVMTRITYRKILACLHPDRIQDETLKKRYEEAFRLFTELEKRVLDEKESPTAFRKMPRTYDELMATRAKAQAERKARRTAGKSAVRF